MRSSETRLHKFGLARGDLSAIRSAPVTGLIDPDPFEAFEAAGWEQRAGRKPLR
ncbi:MAG: hypothetical protein ACR2LV_06920 [Solirubrobacteraceae bacterium]